jgi:hypothetical protein
MSSLEELFATKLASLQPQASVSATPTPGQADTTSSTLVFLLTPEHTLEFTVTLPGAACEAWPPSGIQVLLEQILANCELQITLSTQQARYQGYLQEVKTT